MGTCLLLNRFVRAQRVRIGTLRAAGLGRPALLVRYLGFGLLPAPVAGVLGALADAALALAVTNVYLDLRAIPVLCPRHAPRHDRIGVAIAFAGGGLAAIPPTWAAMRIERAEAMRVACAPAAGA